MIKVIQVSSDTNIGGAGKCILTFLKFFDRQSFDVTAVVPSGSLLAPLIRELSVNVVEINAMKDKSFDLGAVSALVKIFKSEKPDIVHAHASMSAKIAAKLCGVKLIYTRHSVFDPPKRLTHGIGKLVSGFVNNTLADKIIAVAEAAKDNLTATGVDENKISVILNGVEPVRKAAEEEKSAARRKFGIADGERVISIVARLNEVKGHKYFVNAAEIVRNAGVKAKFLIAGTGGEEENIKRLIEEKNLGDTVIMLGFLTDVSELLNITDIQANCSFGTEATSLSLLEGMSLGIPAVVTSFGGNPGVITDGVNGFLTPTHDSEKMAEKIIALLKDNALYGEMSRNAEKIYSERFTSEVYTKNIESLYKKVINI